MTLCFCMLCVLSENEKVINKKYIKKRKVIQVRLVHMNSFGFFDSSLFVVV